MILEREQRLSASSLWEIQRAFFERHAVQAWQQGSLPQYITSNPFIARAYARLVAAFLADLAAPGEGAGAAALRPDAPRAFDLTQPVYVVELGSGSGRFAFHFGRQIGDCLRDAGLKGVELRYVMTDFAEATQESWRGHPHLKPLIDGGLLDVATFDAERPGTLRLLGSGVELSGDQVTNPLIVVANYCFDTLPADVFWVEGGELHESVVSVSTEEDARSEGPLDLERVALSYTRRRATWPYYGDADLDGLLAAYARTLAQTAILFPVTALRCLAHLNARAGGRMLVLAGDKGFGRPEELVGLREPALSVHGGCFSFPVNFHAMAEWSRAHGGEALHTRHRPAFLDVWAFPVGVGATPELRAAFAEAIERAGPDDVYTLTQGMEPRYAELTLAQLLALLRLTGGDSRVFLGSFEGLRAALRGASRPEREEACAALFQVWDAYFHLGPESDVAFLLATLFFEMGDYRQALELLGHSSRLCGPNAGTSYNVALCHYHRRDLGHALRAIEETLALDPTFEQASTLRLLISSELGRRTGNLGMVGAG